MDSAGAVYRSEKCIFGIKIQSVRWQWEHVASGNPLSKLISPLPRRVIWKRGVRVGDLFHSPSGYLWGIKDGWRWYNETTSWDQAILEKWQMYLAVRLNIGKVLIKLCFELRNVHSDLSFVYIWLRQGRVELCEVWSTWHIWNVKLAFHEYRSYLEMKWK